MRIGLVRISQETNSFTPKRTTKDNFASFGIEYGDEVVSGVLESMVRGYLDVAAERDDVETVPIFKARTVAGGPLDAPTLDFLTTSMENGLKQAGQLEGLSLLLHGACAADGEDDVEGHLTERARKIVGPDVPIVLGLDHHANITTRMIGQSNALVGHRTQPHDHVDTGRLAADLLFRIVSGEIEDPVMTWRKIPLLSHQEQYLTTRHPMKTWFDRARDIEQESAGVVQISNFPMQPWLDVAEGGWSTVVVTDGEPILAEQIADELGDLAWSMREEFQVKTSVPPADAVRAAEAADNGVVVISDTGDSVLGGAGGDSTVLLREMLHQEIDGPALVPLVHPAIASELEGADTGDEVTISVGGSVAGMHEPISLTGTLRYSGPAVFEITDRRYSNPRVDVGHAAVLEVPCGIVLITQLPGVGGVLPVVYEHFGLVPSEFKMAVVKTASNFQYFDAISSQVIRANTPGPSQSDITSLPWQRIPRPIYPLDDIDSWQ